MGRLDSQRVGWAVWVAVCLGAFGCAHAPTTRSDWYRVPRGEVICSWKKPTRWYDTGVLLAPRLGVPMARWRAGVLQKNSWSGALVTGALKRTGPHFLFEGTWRGDGIILDADVDASDEAMLFALATVSLGRAGVLARGGDVRVVEGRPNEVLVTPADAALRDFTPVDAPLAPMACEALTLYPQHDDLLKWAGFDPAAPLRLLDRPAPVPVFDAPGGAQVGTFKAGADALHVHQLEAREGWVRIAHPDYTGVVWHGWVQATLREPEPVSDLFGYGGLGTRGSGELVPWKACAVEQRLYARLQGQYVWVGRVTATTPFTLGAGDGRFSPVTFRRTRLDPEKDVGFFFEASAEACGPWIEPQPAAAPTGV